MNPLMSQDAFITILENKLNCVYTDEQRQLIREFDRPTICFASPGTGKTHTAIAGLLNAELYEQIPGDNIYALSFTKMATGELSVRHRLACQALQISQTVTFKTLHSMCAELLRENCRLFNLSKLDTTKTEPLKDTVRLVEDMCQEWGDKITPNIAKQVVLACNSLNSALIFDEDSVKSKMVFKQCKCDYELFTKIRKNLFLRPMFTGKVPVDCIMLYALVLMTRYPEVSIKFKEKCRLMLVDEAQDLSLLHLRIISLLTDNPILIGDMKQQIYAFNGACQEIVEQFYNLFKESSTKQLTQSFRCKNEIINFANDIIKYNELTGDVATGTGDGGSVVLVPDLSLDELASKFHDDYYGNRRLFTRDVLFLFRNNASAIPIVEALYKKQVPMRVNNYMPATEMPVIKEMVQILNLCRNPYNMNYVGALQYLIPELRGFGMLKDNPFYKMCEKNACSVFDVNYIFKDMGIGSKAMSLLLELSEDMKKGVTTKDLFNKLWPMYNDQWVSQRTWMLEYEVSYYTAIVAPIVREKTFDAFVSDEASKASYIKECMEHNRGIRCYTMHASKGLEADDVYILDADPDIIPNTRKLDKMLKAHCEMDAAREVRNERSLCYVAVTRAREHVYIQSISEPASILMGENKYEAFDGIYKTFRVRSDDISAFTEFCA